MELFFSHLLKSCLVLVLFLVAYLLFLKKETFFSANRIFLILGVCTAVLLPFVKITRMVYIAPMPLQFLENTAIPESLTSQASDLFVDIWMLLIIFYATGVFILTLRLLGQLVQIWRIRRKSDIKHDNPFYHVRTPFKIAPFSFFKHIFYHPKQFNKTDLNLIITHEKVHAQELHSLDILLMEALVILQWFNPLAWYYSRMVKQNLEFVADHKTCRQKIDRKQYQYLMLNQVLTHQNLTLVNPFFNSFTHLSFLRKKILLELPGGQIKKRIVMLHQKPSQKKNYLKTLVIIPLLALFLLAFSTEDEIRFKDTMPAHAIKAPYFSSPIQPSKIVRTSSRFGEILRGKYKGKVHKGIDLVAKKGTQVVASASGTVVESAYNSTNGNHVVIDHGNGYFSKYLHMERNIVAPEAVIPAGTLIGYVGNTGVSSGPHLHFEIVMDKKSVDPESFIAFSKKPSTAPTNTITKTPKPQEAIIAPIKGKSAFKNIELIISKNTTDAELEKIKTDLAKEDIDFSYTVVHNAANEIEAIDFQLSGKGANGGTFNNNYYASVEDGVIRPVIIYIDLENNQVSIGSKNLKNFQNSNSTAWIQDDGQTHEEIIVVKEGGRKKILVDGQEVNKTVSSGKGVKLFHVEDYEYNPKTNSKQEKKHKNQTSDVLIVKNNDSNVEIHSNDTSNSPLSIKTVNGKKPLIYIDGEKASENDISKLSSDDISAVKVYKGKKAIKKYGRKAKNGVVEIVTKKKN